MVELPLTVYEQNNQKGILVVFTTILLVIPFLISGLQLNHGYCRCCCFVGGAAGAAVAHVNVAIAEQQQQEQ